MDQWSQRARAMGDISWLHLVWKRHLERGLKAHGISLKQAFVLSQLMADPLMTPSRLATLLFCDRPTATSLVKTLVRRGWVRLAAHASDGRSKVVQLTPLGRRKLASLPATASREVAQAIDPLEPLSAVERQQLLDSLSRMKAHLEPFNRQTEAEDSI
jgi:DNA-binding MarR family transcriptional regulator